MAHEWSWGSEPRSNEPVVIEGREIVGPLCDAGVTLSGGSCGDGGGRFLGTYRLRDGRVGERHIVHGWLERLLVWPDEAAPAAYGPERIQ